MTLSSLFVDINVVILRCHHYLYINVVDLVKITVYSQPIILSILDFIYCTSTNMENFINYLNNKIHEIDIHCILMKPKCTVVLFFKYVYNIICHVFPPPFIQTHNFLCFPPHYFRHTIIYVFIHYFRHTNLTADRFLMVYDLRVMRAMAPIQVIIDPMFLRFIHTSPNKMVITSQVCSNFWQHL